MNAHRRMEAKRARRRKRIAESRGGGRGPMKRAGERAALMNIGERRILAMVAAAPKPQRKPRKAAKKVPPPTLVQTSYGTWCRPEIRQRIEDEHYAADLKAAA